MQKRVKTQRYAVLIFCAIGVCLVTLIYIFNNQKDLNPVPSIEVHCKEGPRGSLEGENTSDTLEEWQLCSGNLRIPQNDSRLLRYIETNHLIPPTGEEYDLTPQQPKVDYKWAGKVSKRVLELLNFSRNGFFIECGANDGQFLSNTLLMETNYGWTGLLVEADPRSLALLTKRHRNAWIADVCLSIVPYPSKIAMFRHKDWEALSLIPKFDMWRASETKYEKFEVQCFPFFSVMSAMKTLVIDYFSMDIEGAELDVLKTIPFDSVFIKIFSIEVAPGNERPMEAFMMNKGYVYDRLVEETHTRDQIYIHKSLL